MFGLGLPEIIILSVTVIASVLGTVIPFWQISKKAGYHPALGILSAIPLVNVAFFYFLAFAKWPAIRDGRQVPGQLASPG